MVKHWHAGWSMPGCLPEEPYATFGDLASARMYLLGEYDHAWDMGTDEAFLEGHTQLHAGATSVMADGYVYEIVECHEGHSEV